MPWRSLGQFNLTQEWQFSIPVSAEIFRIHHENIEDISDLSLRAVIAQGFFDLDQRINRFNPKIFTYSDDSEIFSFYFPIGLTSHSLIFKRLDNNLTTSWWIEAEYLYADNPMLDYQNYINTRFGQLGTQILNDQVIKSVEEIFMALYPRGGSEDKKLSLVPQSREIRLRASVAKRLLRKNNDRKKLTIRSGMHSVTLATGFDPSGVALEVIETIPPNYNFDLPSTDDAIFQGEIWAMSSSGTFVAYTEYSLQDKGEDDKVEAPTEEAPTEEAPTEEAPTEEAPTEEAPTEEAPTEESSN